MNEELWPLPPGWRWQKASEIAEIVGGGTPTASDESNFDPAGVPWITPADLTGYEKTYIAGGRRGLSKKGLASCGARVMPAGSVLYSSRAPIGYCAIASNPISTNQGFKSLVLNDGSVPEFVRYYLLASKDYAESLASGTTFKELSGSRMGEMLVPVAPPKEQRLVVAKLDNLFKRSKSAREELNRIPRLVERYKQAILASAFCGELTVSWRKKHPHKTTGKQLLAELLTCRAKHSTKKGGGGRTIDQPEDLQALPHGWTWCLVAILASTVSDGVHKKPEYVEQGIPFLTVRNLTAGPGITFDGCRYVTPSDHKEFIKRTHPERGDLLISKDGTLGVVRAIRTDVVFSIFVSVALVKPVDRSMTDYLELAFTAPQVQQQMVGVGTGLQHIHLTDLRRDFIPIAPAEERAEIVKRVHSAFAYIERLETETIRATKLLDRLDLATLGKAFRGDLMTEAENLKSGRAYVAR